MSAVEGWLAGAGDLEVVEVSWELIEALATASTAGLDFGFLRKAGTSFENRLRFNFHFIVFSLCDSVFKYLVLLAVCP